MQDDPIRRDQVGRAVGIVGLSGIALIHLLDAVAKYGETRYIFFLYILLMASTLAAAVVLLRLDSRLAWSLVVLTTVATLTAYVLSRTTGLPHASQDVGKWSDSLGVASVFVEGCTLLLGVYKLVTIVPAPRPGAREALWRGAHGTVHRPRTPILSSSGEDRSDGAQK